MRCTEPFVISSRLPLGHALHVFLTFHQSCRIMQGVRAIGSTWMAGAVAVQVARSGIGLRPICLGVGRNLHLFGDRPWEIAVVCRIVARRVCCFLFETCRVSTMVESR